MKSSQKTVNDEKALDVSAVEKPQENVVPTETTISAQPAEVSVGEETPAPEVQEELTQAEIPYTVDQDKIAAKVASDKTLADKLESREALPATGDPSATVSDPFTVNVAPRYTVMQNQSDKFLVVPDMKTNDEDMGLVFEPGEVVLLTDFYSPQQINRSKGLRYAATKLLGVSDKFMLIPLAREEDGKAFVAPQKKKYAKGTSFEDMEQNDFDDRFAELEQREAKREEKLLKKTLASRTTKKHGQAPVRV